MIKGWWNFKVYKIKIKVHHFALSDGEMIPVHGWRWLKGSLNHIELVDGIQNASYFTVSEVQWFQTRFYNQPDRIKYQEYMA
jgi:hypothetical protein